MGYTVSLGEKVRNKRLQMNFSQAELSQRTGLSTGHISDIENGNRTSVQIKTIRKLAKGLEMSITELVGDEEGEE